MSLYAQSDFFKNYNGIPITTNLWGKEAWMYDRYNFKDIDSAGIDAVVVTNTNSYLYENFRKASTKFKLIPYMHMKNTDRTGICFFSEKAYTVFEAEGDPDLAINLDNSSGIEYYDGSIRGVTNNPYQNLSCNIIQGTEHYGNLAKSTINDLPLNLSAKFYIKINWRNENNHPASIQNYLNFDICKLSITAKKDNAVYDTTFAEITLKVSDLMPLNGYKQITLPYFTSSKGVPENITQQILRLTYATQGELYWVIPNVKYHVYWYEIPDLSLYVDKIVLFDPNGNALTNNLDLSSFSLPNEVNFNLGDPFSTNEVVGWYPVDEPDLIDMQSCLAKLDTIINQATPQLYLMPGVACSWDGNLFESGSSSKILEFSRRGKYNGSIMHKYLYDDPYTPLDGQDYYLGNIICYIANLKNYQEADPNFICSIQSGIWSNDSAHIKRKIHPSPKQFLYNTNLALLYGAKGIDVNDYYYYINDPNVENRTGMVGIYGYNSANNYNLVPTPIWYTLRDTISPRLKGNYGKALKKLKQYKQDYFNSSTSFLSFEDEYYELLGYFTKNSSNEYDCGWFYDPDINSNKKYAMAVSRYYNNSLTDSLYLNMPISHNKNYTIRELYDDSTYSIFSNSSDWLTIPRLILPGAAILIELSPSVEFGGNIVENENIISNTTLYDKLVVNSNKVLSVIGENITYTLKDTLIIDSNATLTCDQGAKIDGKRGNILFYGSGRYATDNWQQSLFYVNESGHPKLIWGSLTGNQTYKVYKIINGTYVCIATLNSTDNNHIQTFVDLDEYISNQLASSNRMYKVGRLSNGRYLCTNIITVNVQGGMIEKELSDTAIKEFALEQNYPNPFNPTTTINYTIPESGRVNVKLYDMLGREVKTLFEGIQSMGSYNLDVNCNNMASGVYIYRIQYNDKILSKKMILQK